MLPTIPLFPNFNVEDKNAILPNVDLMATPKVKIMISHGIFQVYLKDPRPASALTEHLDTWAAMDPGHVSELWNRGNVARLPLLLIFLGMPKSLDNQLILRWYQRTLSQSSTLSLSDDKIKTWYPISKFKCTTCFVLLCKTLTDAITRFVFDWTKKEGSGIGYFKP